MGGKNSSKERGSCIMCDGYCPPEYRATCPKNNNLGSGVAVGITCIRRDINDLGRPQDKYLQNGAPRVVAVP